MRKRIFTNSRVLCFIGIFSLFVPSCDKGNHIEEPQIIEVKSVSLNKTELELHVGDSYQLTATVMPQNATEKHIHWTSDQGCVNVSEEGLVTAMALGTAKIIAIAGEKTSVCTVNVTPIVIKSITLSKTSMTLNFGESEVLTATVEPENATNGVFWVSDDESVASVDSKGKVEAKGFGNTVVYARGDDVSASCTVEVRAFEPEAVDLGLSVKWASFDLLATSFIKVGGRFAWGETNVKDSYVWTNYKWCMGTSETLTKYCYDSFYGYNGFTDQLTRLEKEDDAASAILGGTWRMPTIEEIAELLDNCTTEWIKESEEKKYVKFTSKKNGNYICFTCPGSPYNYNKYLSSDLKVNYFGAGYSSSLCIFKGENCFGSDAGRSDGNYIRPVCE